MNFKTVIHTVLSLTLLALAACSHDDLKLESEDNTQDKYLLLRIALPAEAAKTRSNPMGGEEGNGREEGLENENKIHDINLFFYDDRINGNKGLESPDDTQILYHVYYNSDDENDPNNTTLEELEDEDRIDGGNFLTGPNYYQLSFKIPEDKQYLLRDGIKFAAVANLGYIENINTLGQLRNYEFNASLSLKNIADKKANEIEKFPMSTAYNAEYKYNGKTTGNNTIRLAGAGNHFEGVTTVERIYARLDLWYKESENAVKDGNDITCLKYKVKANEQDYTDNMVYICNVLPVNVMQNPSYLFKKVTNANPAPTEWIKASIAAINSFNWAGKETPNAIPTSTPNDLPTNYVMERHTLDKSADGTTGQLNDWYGSTAIDKVRDDIKVATNGKLSAYYHGVPNSDTNPNYGCDHIAIISYANENTHPTDCFHSNYLTGLAFRGLYIPAKIYSAYDAVTGELTELTNNTAVPAQDRIYQYSPSTGDGNNKLSERYNLYFSNKKAAEDYRNFHLEESGIITEFKSEYNANYGFGFICYYNLWLRHYNDETADPQRDYPMEYATVRNNIYRVSISFNGPGDPSPTMREPDTMQARIFVRKWNYRKENKPLEF